jgi:hypothetical protein
LLEKETLLNPPMLNLIWRIRSVTNLIDEIKDEINTSRNSEINLESPMKGIEKHQKLFAQLDSFLRCFRSRTIRIASNDYFTIRQFPKDPISIEN